MTYPSLIQYILLVHCDSSIAWAVESRDLLSFLGFSSVSDSSPTFHHDTVEAHYVWHPLANVTYPSRGWALATQLLHETQRMLTLDCYESHVPTWDCKGVGEGVTHLPADIKINYYWIKNAWLLHTMCTGRSCHYAGTRSSAQCSQKKPENKQYSILPSKGKAYRKGITYGVNNRKGEMPGMLWNVVTTTKIHSCTSTGHCWKVNTSQDHSELFICVEAQH